jgi:Fungal specific transcription factor domain
MPSAVSPVATRDLGDEDESRFVGDLNPEGIFLASTSPAATTGSAEPDGLGFWLSRRATDSVQGSYHRIPLKQSRSTLISNRDPLISKLLLPYLEDQCLSLLPKSADFESLSGIYFEHVHPIFPVLDRDAFGLMPNEMPAKVLLKQAICLAASTNGGAEQFLNLSKDTTLGHKDFAEQLSLAIRTSLDLGLVKDRLVQIQVLAILSLFNQLSDDRHWSAELTGRAVSCVHTTGLHLQTYESRKDHDYVTRLFCCIWALDRLNAAFHGRPVLMHERDFGRDLKTCFAQQEGCFHLFLQTVFLLDKVIDLYRPTADGSRIGWESEFPSFEELLHETGSSRVSSHLVGERESAKPTLQNFHSR